MNKRVKNCLSFYIISMRNAKHKKYISNIPLECKPSSGSNVGRFPPPGLGGRADAAETVNSGHVQPETLKKTLS